MTPGELALVRKAALIYFGSNSGAIVEFAASFIDHFRADDTNRCSCAPPIRLPWCALHGKDPSSDVELADQFRRRLADERAKREAATDTPVYVAHE